MRFASLGSGSAGNALIVESKQTRVMLDCGFSIKETVARLARIQLSPEDLAGIIVTHEHDDHAKGAYKFGAKFNVPVWSTYGTRKMSERYLPVKQSVDCREVDAHQPFSIGGIQVKPYPVPHDAREPMQCVFGDGNVQLGVLTDVGKPTPHILEMLTKSDALFLECNHDEQMLRTGPYAQSLKKRVGGDLGHLENQVSAALLAKLDNSKLKHIVGAHLSEKNNKPELVKHALANVLNCELDWVGIAEQAAGSKWREIVA